MFELRKLSPDDGEDVYRMLQEIPRDENGFVNTANGLSRSEYREWLQKQQRSSEQEGIVDGWRVPCTTYWLYEDGVPVGFGKLRHFLTDALRREGGHIGYAVAPRYRGKGCGKELLRAMLEKANALGIEKVLVTVKPENTASQAVALANGGVLTERTDERVFFWIDTKERSHEEKG